MQNWDKKAVTSLLSKFVDQLSVSGTDGDTNVKFGVQIDHKE